MEIIEVQRRDMKLKAKQLRRAGAVPGSIFGGSLPESISIRLDEPVAQKILREKREGSRLKLRLEGETIPVQIKDCDYDLLNNKVIHMAFQALKKGQKVNSVAHILIEGTEALPGTLEKLRTEVPYASLPENMIDTVTLNLENKPVGTAICVGDIPELCSEDIELQCDRDELVLKINEKRRVEE